MTILPLPVGKPSTKNISENYLKEIKKNNVIFSEEFSLKVGNHQAGNLY
jgi:hypothetical protein